MPKKTFSLEQRYIGGITSRLNSVNKSQIKKIQKQEFDESLPKVKFSDVFFRQKNQWVYKGKCCMSCNIMMDDPYVLENHHYVCTVNKQKQKDNGTD